MAKRCPIIHKFIRYLLDNYLLCDEKLSSFILPIQFRGPALNGK